jgi:SAM-dependent methyltransferase
MSTAALPLLDSFSALADATRCRMLWLLEQQELTVSELCGVLQLPQSTVSRHLKTLADAGWVTSRRDGTSRYYALAPGGADEARTQIWALTRAQLVGRPGVEQDGRRLLQVLAGRGRTSQAFFATAAGEWDHLRADLFGGQFSSQALVSLLPDHWIVADLGCGTGPLLPLLSSAVRQVIGVDGSEEMLAAARSRTVHLANVDLRRGPLEALPIDDHTLDAAVMMLVLHHLPSPAAALSEACRVLKPGGRLLIVDMAPHEHEEYRQHMGHVWLGFGEDQLRRLCELSGLDVRRIAPIVPVTEAKGPTLFAATAVKPVTASSPDSVTATTEE